MVNISNSIKNQFIKRIPQISFFNIYFAFYLLNFLFLIFSIFVNSLIIFWMFFAAENM